MASPTTIRTPYVQRLELVKDTIQDSLQAWRQGCKRPGRARPARAEFNPREDALNNGPAVVPHS